MWQEIDYQTANDFNFKNSHSELLESSVWLELQKNFHQVYLLGHYSNEQLIAVTILIRKALPFGLSYFYSPRGPLIAKEFNNLNIWSKLLDDIKPWLKQQQALFWRIEPLNEISDANFSQLKLKRSPDIQPSQTRMLDLTLSEEELLQQMHPKTRYNIRLASKRGVTVESTGAAGFDDFWQLMKTTGERDKFHLHGRDYYKAITEKPFSQLLIARQGETVLAAGIFAYWQQTAIYLHGASSNEKRELMAPYLIQWEAIKLARQLNCQRYDFFGINPSKWPGVTRFKQGFGGYIVDYPGVYDLPIKQLSYNLYSLFRRIRRAVH
ncbi:MAG TPA: peptidoglycan bridge formation glycyltransferase FemA/FemB family protein [bacterium]|nr:peptidoglycan bridge formation glycyltransferase FemA/FemB family protein [bacterium]